MSYNFNHEPERESKLSIVLKILAILFILLAIYKQHQFGLTMDRCNELYSNIEINQQIANQMLEQIAADTAAFKQLVEVDYE